MTAQNYNAPALEKGLEILELLAGQADAMAAGEICSTLGRSKPEIYRMLLTLEAKGYIHRDASGSGYRITSRLFELGMIFPPSQNLIETALPHMRALAGVTGQSCHMTLISDRSVVAVARAESEATAGFAVKVGFRASAAYASSGRVIYAFQTRKQQAVWLNWMRTTVKRADLRIFLNDAARVHEQGYFVRDSYYTKGITDMVVPLLQGKKPFAVAALVIPFLTHIPCQMEQDQVLEKLRETASRISEELY